MTPELNVEFVTVDGSCEEHGTYTVQRPTRIGDMDLGPVARAFCPKCTARRHAEEEQRRSDRNQAENEGYLFDRAGVPKRFRHMSFDDFTATTDPARRALKIVKNYADHVLRREEPAFWLVLTGRPGTGKTMLLTCMCRFLIEHDLRPLYVTASGMDRAFRNTYQRTSEVTEAALFDRVTRAPLLLVDEIIGFVNEHAARMLFDVLDARYAAGMPTMIATNLARDDLASAIGERLYDRLCEDATFLPFDWPSHRQARNGHRGKASGDARASA